MNRVRTFLGIVSIVIVTALLSGCAAVTVFRAGHPLLPVIVAENAAPEERAAASELSRVLGAMSGLTWPLHTGARAGERGIYVGHDFWPEAVGERRKVSSDLLAPGPKESGPDEFQIATCDGSVFIAGATPEANGYAVAWLLQQQANVRWYAPGSLGEVIPRRSHWSLPRLRVRRSPAYLSREIYGAGSAQGTDWARHNGLRSRLEFNHALAAIFPAAVLAEHPDWAPQLNDRRYQPGSVNDHNWQPNLALPAVAEQAARTAAAAFALNPGRPSFSLGINDTVRFDQSPASRALVEPLRYFRGMPNYSPLVFTFMNRAAETVALKSPGHYLGCLAYFWCEEPPPFRVNAVVVPYVTTDRSQYYDADYRAADLKLMSRWRESGVRTYGVWEYAYGWGFLVPRVPCRAMAEGIREGWHRGARGYMADAGSQWGFDTFKIWMMAQLLWEPDRSVEELAGDFYAGYFKAAAGPMRRFFERSEAQWMAQSGPPFWLKLYQQEDQALLFPLETCRELRGWLDQAAIAVAGDPVAAARVERTSRAFAVTEAYVQYDAKRRRLAAVDGAIAPDREQILSDLIREWVQAEAGLREKVAAASAGDFPGMTFGELSGFVQNDPVPRLLWLAAQGDLAAPLRIVTNADNGVQARSNWRALAEAFAHAALSTAPILNPNSSLQAATTTPPTPQFLNLKSGPLPEKWEVKAMPTELGKVSLIDRGERGGQSTLRMEGAWDTQLFQWLPVEPDCTYLATANVRGHSGLGGDAALYLTFLDEAGNVLSKVCSQSLPKGVTEEWRTLVQGEQAPDLAAWVGIGVGANRQGAADWLEVDRVELRGVITIPPP